LLEPTSQAQRTDCFDVERASEPGDGVLLQERAALVPEMARRASEYDEHRSRRWTRSSHAKRRGVLIPADPATGRPRARDDGLDVDAVGTPPDYDQVMGLRDFLNQHEGSAGDKPPSSEIAAWQAAVSTLVARFKEVLAKYEQLRLTDWAVLREHRGVRYNAEALTIEFGESPVTLEPLAIKPVGGILGRASLNCGVRQVHLDCADDGKLWRYHWVIPSDPKQAELTDEAIEELVEELFKSSAG
jgi:hypothetical protein